MTLAEHMREQQQNIEAASSQLDNAANEMAAALLPRLRKVSAWRLQLLKAALKDLGGRNSRWLA